MSKIEELDQYNCRHLHRCQRRNRSSMSVAPRRKKNAGRNAAMRREIRKKSKKFEMQQRQQEVQILMKDVCVIAMLKRIYVICLSYCLSAYEEADSLCDLYGFDYQRKEGECTHCDDFINLTAESSFYSKFGLNLHIIYLLITFLIEKI